MFPSSIKLEVKTREYFKEPKNLKNRIKNMQQVVLKYAKQTKKITQKNFNNMV